MRLAASDAAVQSLCRAQVIGHHEVVHPTVVDEKVPQAFVTRDPILLHELVVNGQRILVEDADPAGDTISHRGFGL